MNAQQRKARILELGHEAARLCEQMERGQAATPLGEHLRRVLDEVESAPFSVVLLALSPDALRLALAWLFGEHFALIAVNSNSLPGLMEITVAEQGFALHRPDRSYQLFENIESFMSALDATLRVEQARGLSHLRMSVSSGRAARGLKIFVPESVGLLLDDPSLLNALIAETNLMMVAAPLRYVLTRDDEVAVEALARNMDAFVPLLVVDELKETPDALGSGWWERHARTTELLPPRLLTTHVQARMAEFIADPDDPVRQRLFLQFYAGRLKQAVDALAARQRQDMRLLEQKRPANTAQGSGARNETRRLWDQLRQALEDTCHEIRKTQEAAIGRFTLAVSPVWQDLQQRLEAITLADLNMNESHSRLILTLKEGVVKEFNESVLQHSKALLKEQWLQWQEQARNIVVHSNGQLQALASPGLSEPNLPSRGELYDALAERSGIHINYRGEMPRRTFVDRLSDGRKVIMGMSMVVMVLGGLGTALWGIDLRAMLATLAPLLFLAAFIYTYIVWPREDAERMDKELERIRDGIRSELKRLMGEIQRAVQGLVNDMSDSQRRRWQNELKDLQQQYDDRQMQQEQKQREQLRQQDQVVGQQLRQAQQVERDLLRIQGDLDLVAKN